MRRILSDIATSLILLTCNVFSPRLNSICNADLKIWSVKTIGIFEVYQSIVSNIKVNIFVTSD